MARMPDFELIKMTSVNQLDGYASDSYRCGVFSSTGESASFQEIEWTRRRHVGDRLQKCHQAALGQCSHTPSGEIDLPKAAEPL